MTQTHTSLSVGKGLLAISPIIVFLVLYLVTSLIIGDFYKMPISIAMFLAMVWALTFLQGRSLTDRLNVLTRGASEPNVIFMIWIFILAGIFAAVARYIGAVEATVNLAIASLHPSLIVPGLFLITCFISMAIGTSVGTVVALTPIAVEMAADTGGSVPYFVAIVLGGAFFGDNLSFISDTTIAATRTQGCNMKDKFMANLRIVLPAALLSLIVYCLNAPEISIEVENVENKEIWLMVPYLIVIVSAIAGVNVVLVLILGIFSACLVGICYGNDFLQLAFISGEGVDSVGGLIIITLMAAGLLAIIKEAGGIDFILAVLSKNLNSSKGGQLVITLITGLVNLCTANNTVAILTVGSVAKDISSRFAISPKRSASLLDTSSCIVQALIPYGAQSLMAASLSSLSPVEFWPYLFYPQILAGILLLAILFGKGNKKELD